jgi:glutamate--cysteine ligase
MPWSSPLLEAPAPTRAALAADLAATAFRPSRWRRIGAEAELIPVEAATGRVVPIAAPEGPSTLPLLRERAQRAGWTEVPAPDGPPRFLAPDGGVVSYEPGGQIEFSAFPCASVGALVEALHAVVLPLREEAAARGVLLLSLGIDPINALEAVPLQLHGERYAGMDEFFARIGPAGARMMRQTASFQVNVDWEEEVAERWRVLNAVAPLLTAIFASSPRCAGATGETASLRSLLWRELDPGRTGVLPGVVPVEEYLRFALGARTMLKRAEDGSPLPCATWLRSGSLSLAEWHLHLSTLFPEVRPKGFAEVRSLDAVAPEWYAAPLVLLAGVVYHRPTLLAALELLGPPDPALLPLAGVVGLRDPLLAARAAELFELALRGARALGPPMVDPPSLAVAEDFFQHFTRRARSPADDVLPGSTAG